MTPHGGPLDAPRAPRKLGLRSGVGLVVSSMVGAGVFVSAGFMVQSMGPGTVLLCWAAGAVLALCGALAYGAIAGMVPRSGGEYRYLSDLWHPALGFAAGWASLVVGFSAPIAVNALSAGAYVDTLGLRPASALGLGSALTDAQLTGTVLVVALTAVHLVGLRASKSVQAALVALTWLLLAGFVVLGLVAGSHAWPQWTPPAAAPDGAAAVAVAAGDPSAANPPAFPLAAFMGSLFFVAFAFSGWNAAAYTAEDFREPRSDVPRAMLLGCALVAGLYLLVNWVFVANLTPERAAIVMEYEESRITLGHLVTRDLAGPAGGAAMSLLATLAFASSMSAMTFSGPRMYAAMARDGVLPRVLAGRRDRVPAAAIVLQGALALALVHTHRLASLLANVGAVLTLFSALTAAAVIRARVVPRAGQDRPGLGVTLAAAVYAASAAWLLYFGVTSYDARASLRLWLAGIALVAAGAYVARRVRGPGRGRARDSLA